MSEGASKPAASSTFRAGRIVAVALLDEYEARNVATSIKRLYPVTDDGSFDDILAAIDQAAKRRR